jgi:gliding motility-associated-like protein
MPLSLTNCQVSAGMVLGDLPYGNGLYRRRYTGYFADNVDFFATATQVAESVTTSPIEDGHSGDNFSVQWLGYFLATTTDTFLDFSKPRELGRFRLHVHTINDQDGRYARSNYLEFSVDELELEVYNVVTPNGDGVNDAFYIRYIEAYPQARVRLFNRWGQSVYDRVAYANDYQPADLEAGSYVYVIEVPGKTPLQGILRVQR